MRTYPRNAGSGLTETRPQCYHVRVDSLTPNERENELRHLTVFIGAVAGLLAACTDLSNPTRAADEDSGYTAALGEIAYAAAKALGSSEVRTNVLAAMRASVRVEHALLLGEYLSRSDGAQLRHHAARALGMTEKEFHEKVLALPTLELVVPVRDHRLDWTGSAHIGVAGSLDSDVSEFTVHEPSGLRRSAVSIPQLLEYDVFFYIRPQEGFGTRIDRQADVPGPVIQDPDDGEQAVIVTVTMEGGATRSVDYGQFDNVLELQSALANLHGAGTSVSGDETYADSEECNSELIGDDCRERDDGRPGGGNDERWSEDPTHLKHWGGDCEVIGGDGIGTSEVEVWLSFYTRSDEVRSEGVDCDNDENDWVSRTWPDPGEYMLGASVIDGPRAVRFRLDVIETDWLADDVIIEDFQVLPKHRNILLWWKEDPDDELAFFHVRLRW